MKSYQRFLYESHEQLVEAIAEAENNEWHHKGPGSPEYGHYLRLNTWEAEVMERMVHYAAAKTRSAWKRFRRDQPPGTQEGNVLGRHDHRLEPGVGGTG